jgi:hypothetical protein
MLKFATVAALTALTLAALAVRAEDKAAPTGKANDVVFTVVNRKDAPMTFTAADIARLRHVEVSASKDRVYRGVPLADFLRLAGVIWEGKCSPLLTCYVLVEAADGYRILFSIPEIDPGQCHKMVILADQCNGNPLPKAEGPYETIEQDAKQRGRWVHHATKVTLVQALPHARPKVK